VRELWAYRVLKRRSGEVVTGALLSRGSAGVWRHQGRPLRPSIPAASHWARLRSITRSSTSDESGPALVGVDRSSRCSATICAGAAFPARRSIMQKDFEDLDDRELLLAASSDRDAFAEVYRRHVSGVLGYFFRAVGRSDIAFDLTAETFAAALLALPGYRASAAPGRAWLYAIAHNRLVDSLRRGEVEARAREQLGMHAIALSDDGEEALERTLANVVGQSALELVKGLPDEQRDAVVARFLEDRDYAEIAAELRCSEQVVRKRVSRGLATLRRQLGVER